MEKKLQVTNAYIKIISRRRASCVLRNRFMVCDLDWAKDIPRVVTGDVPRMQKAILLHHAKVLIQSEQVNRIFYSHNNETKWLTHKNL
jgi:hypothetical protein